VDSPVDSPTTPSVAPTNPPTNRGRRCVSAETLRTAQPSEDWDRDVAPWWQALSPLPKERGQAINRFRSLQGRLDPAVLFLALGEWALGRDERGEPYHARGFTELVARERIGRIRETLREIEKAEERVEVRGKPHGMRSMADLLAAIR